MAFPVRVLTHDNAGNAYGLSAVIQPDRMVRVLQRQVIPPTTVISVLDASGTIVARSRNHAKAVGGRPSPTTRAFLATPGQEIVGKTVTMEGDHMTAAFTRRSRYGWTVIVGVPSSILPQTIVNGFTGYGLGIAISLAACIGLATLLARRIVRAFDGLQAGTTALGAGGSGAGGAIEHCRDRADGTGADAGSRAARRP